MHKPVPVNEKIIRFNSTFSKQYLNKKRVGKKKQTNLASYKNQETFALASLHKSKLECCLSLNLSVSEHQTTSVK